MLKKNQLIAITGFGSISSLGIERDEIWNNYLNDNTCFQNKIFNNKEYPVASLNPAAEKQLKELEQSDKNFKRLDRTVLMSINAGKKAFEDAGWKNSNYKNIGVNIGSARGATGLWEKLHEEYLNSPKQETFLLTSPLTTLGNVSSEVASFLEIYGPVISNSTTCSTAFQSIGNAIAWLKADMADAFLTGGVEAPLTKFTLAQTEALGIYTKDIFEKYPARPFGSEENLKNTFTIGEGGAVFAVEKIKEEDLKNKKLLVIIESMGYAYERPPSATGLNPDGSLIYKSMKNAIENMLTSNPVDLVLMHGTGTVKGDAAEMNAVKIIFKKDMPNLFSNKWKIGHTYAASAALHLELAILCLLNNKSFNLPYPNIFNNQKRNIKKVMINATGFGGNAASLIISKI